MSATVLSTKKLLPNQKKTIHDSGIALVEYNAITIAFLNTIKADNPIKNAIITSQNTVKALIKNKIVIQNCYCVGKKTKDLLEKNNYQVKEVANYGKELAEIVAQKYKEENFTFFCGNIRSEEIPKALKENNINFEEIVVYKTTLQPKKFNQQFEGVLFFSPSAVQSFMMENKQENGTAFCIGMSTAEEAKKHTKNIIIANTPSIESVLEQVIKNLI
ncbi:MAG: uroporphyrinogen-III synthase [Bacteroidetes bacterium HGW-Bacteroidetes-2]|jgi:uroporphyrinogen-III synthase|nr:MAG: uroporphyrinogen-III synthase [Bacteroidetes bacterium HGW-Bacteroidetes-2]